MTYAEAEARLVQERANAMEVWCNSFADGHPTINEQPDLLWRAFWSSYLEKAFIRFLMEKSC